MKRTFLCTSLLTLTLVSIGVGNDHADATDATKTTTLSPRTEISAAGPVTIEIAGSGVKANQSASSRQPQITDIRDRRSALDALEPRPVLEPVPTAFETAVLRQINTVRANRGLRRLGFSTQLRSAAASHTIEMARAGYFEHRSANGGLWWQRINRFYPSGAHAAWAVGENLLWSSMPLSPADITTAWLASPTHRAILLDPVWREVGAANRRSRATGIYSRYGQVMILTVDFGSRH